MLKNKKLTYAAGLFVLFLLFTVLVKTVHVRPLGPEGSTVGFAGLNAYFLARLSFSRFWYGLADVLGVFSILLSVFFALVGLQQLIHRRNLWKVDAGILLLGCFYILLLLLYGFFEKVIIDFRPVILKEGLEASYPSSHTVMAICVMGSAIPRLRSLSFFRKEWLRYAKLAAVALAVLTVLSRFLSGAHWCTDILGGLLLSAALLMLYYALDEMFIGRPGKHER